MEGAAFTPKSGAGKYNWGCPMDDYNHSFGVDIETLDADEREDKKEGAAAH